MNTFYRVTLFFFLVGMLIVSFYAPWTSSLKGVLGISPSIGYAPIWSSRFADIPGSKVDLASFAMMAAVVAFFSIVIGASAYFFRGKRSGEKDLTED